MGALEHAWNELISFDLRGIFSNFQRILAIVELDVAEIRITSQTTHRDVLRGLRVLRFGCVRAKWRNNKFSYSYRPIDEIFMFMVSRDVIKWAYVGLIELTVCCRTMSHKSLLPFLVGTAHHLVPHYRRHKLTLAQWIRAPVCYVMGSPGPE